jgi:hypothetical protein
MVLDKRVADCAALAALTGTELFYADNSGSDVKVTSSAVRVFAYPPVNVRDFGAAGDAIVSTAGSVYTVTPVTNDTTAIQAALTFGATFTPPRPVYIPAGYYYISNRLTLAAGQTLFAESPHSGFLAMNGSFNLATDGVVKFGANCSVRDLGFLFQQAPTATRATAIQYPAAIRASGDFPKVDNVFIAGAWVGIDCTYHSVDNTQGNGFRVKNVEVGALHTGFAANYSFDFAMVDNFHGKPFGMATASDALGAAYRDGNQLWHTDSTFKEVPALASVLSARIIPAKGGETEYVSTRLAFARLEPALRQRLENSFAWHDYAHSRSKIAPGLATPVERAALPPQCWRLVWKNPANGRSALYIA